MNVLAIDQGTSSTKAIVVADGGEVLGESSAPVSPRPAGQGAVEQDPEELLRSIVEAGRSALEQYGASVMVATSAREAHARFAGHPPDVLVSDLAMPGEDGIHLIRAIRDDDRVLNQWLRPAADIDPASPRGIRVIVDVKIAARKR